MKTKMTGARSWTAGLVVGAVLVTTNGAWAQSDTMKKDVTTPDTMKPGSMKKDAMGKDEMKDGRAKDGMMKDGMMKDGTMPDADKAMKKGESMEKKQ